MLGVAHLPRRARSTLKTKEGKEQQRRQGDESAQGGREVTKTEGLDAVLGRIHGCRD